MRAEEPNQPMIADPTELARSWFALTSITPRLTAITEPFVHDIFRAWMFHLRGRDADLVVDFGMGLASLRAVLDLRPGKPVIAVATHAHADHVGSLHEFADRAGPRIEATAFATMADERTYAGEFRGLEAPVSRPPWPGWTVADYRIAPGPLTRLLDEGDRVDLGDRRFTVLHLPGHSPGSIGLFDEANGEFFSGDAIYDDELYDQLPDSDRVAYQATMRRLLDLPAQIVHGGHGPSFNGARMRAIAERYLARG